MSTMMVQVVQVRMVHQEDGAHVRFRVKRAKKRIPAFIIDGGGVALVQKRMSQIQIVIEGGKHEGSSLGQVASSSRVGAESDGFVSVDGIIIRASIDQLGVRILGGAWEWLGRRSLIEIRHGESLFDHGHLSGRRPGGKGFVSHGAL